MIDTRTSDQLSMLRTRSPAEPKDSVFSTAADKKLVSTKPKATRQRMIEADRLPKPDVGKMKPVGSAGGLSKKTVTSDDKTDKKPPGRPPSGPKVGEKFAKKKPLLEKKSAASGQVEVKRTLNLLVEKVDSDKSSAQKRVCVHRCVFCS